jgi:hypothetical protein
MTDPFDISFAFSRKPVPIPALLRPELRVALILLCLSRCWGERATRRHLHVLNWAVRTPEAQLAFKNVIGGHLRPDAAIVRFDPILDRALQYAEGEKLILTSGDTVHLQPKGSAYLKRLQREKDCMAQEKSFLTEFTKKFTKDQLDSFIPGGVA